jgi:hypothetical protein
MRVGATLLKRAVGRFNAGVTSLADSPRFGPVLGRHITTVSYTGRRSGRTFAIPVGYRRVGDVVTISVAMPDSKSWWRNFTGAGHLLTLRLNGTEQVGHAVADRDARGRVTVTVQLDETRRTDAAHHG